MIFSSPEPKAPGTTENHCANLIQISYGDSSGRGNEILLKWSWSHDQDGHHTYIW